MKKIVMTLAAALCCTMTTSGFIACGGYYEPPEPQTPEEQEEPAEEPEKKAPATVKVQFFVENKADMLNYLDIVVKCSNGQRVFYSNVLSEELVEASPDSDSYYFRTNLFVSKLPAQFKIWREVEVKEAFRDSVYHLNAFDYSNFIDYSYTLYDANNQMIDSATNGQLGSIKSTAGNLEMVREFLGEIDGIFGDVYELNFDEEGNRVSSDEREGGNEVKQTNKGKDNLALKDVGF